MRQFPLSVILFLLASLGMQQTFSQEFDCAFKPPFITINFGSGNAPDVNSITLPKYRRDLSTCPEDGYYSFASSTGNCFRGDWLTINEDHTANGLHGNMMLVNASETGGIFFYNHISGFKSNTSYLLSVWMMNVCRINGGCAPLPPDISIALTTPGGRIAGLFKTGLLTQTDAPKWRRYTGFFQTPPGVTSLNLQMKDNTLGGCGNDFALDDITISECYNPNLQVKDMPVAVVQQPIKIVQQAIKQETPPAKETSLANPPKIKKMPVIPKQVKKDTAIATAPTDNKAISIVPVIKGNTIIKIPEPLLTRANPIVKQIKTTAGEIAVDLYDNGEIDGDTVSVYHNNELVVSRAGLSEKPVSFHIKIDKTQPHHELTMVANNLGTIPPNTSMMIITVNNERYEVFISSSEQTNAKVVIDLKE